MSKSRDAFRTISEVSEWLETPAHVLRFWESKFTQVKPVKRAGGRRYYRPADMELLGGIKKLLHDEGMTIKGVQKVLREQGVRYVAGLSAPVDPEDEPIEDAPFTEVSDAEALASEEAHAAASVLAFPGKTAQPEAADAPELPEPSDAFLAEDDHQEITLPDPVDTPTAEPLEAETDLVAESLDDEAAEEVADAPDLPDDAPVNASFEEGAAQTIDAAPEPEATEMVDLDAPSAEPETIDAPFAEAAPLEALPEMDAPDETDPLESAWADEEPPMDPLPPMDAAPDDGPTELAAPDTTENFDAMAEDMSSLPEIESLAPELPEADAESHLPAEEGPEDAPFDTAYPDQGIFPFDLPEPEDDSVLEDDDLPLSAAGLADAPEPTDSVSLVDAPLPEDAIVSDQAAVDAPLDPAPASTRSGVSFPDFNRPEQDGPEHVVPGLLAQIAHVHALPPEVAQEIASHMPILRARALRREAPLF